MANKTVRLIVTACAAVILGICTFGGGFAAGHFLPFGAQPAPAALATDNLPADLQTLQKPFWEAWSLVHQDYVDQPVNDTELIQGAIRGMIAALGDEHSAYMDQQEFASVEELLSDQYSGIGAWVNTTSGTLLVIDKPMPGSPAEKAGLKPGDQVIGVDGQDVTNLDAELVRTKIVGQEGTTVHLTIRRAGIEQPLEFTITRAKIVVPSVAGEMQADGVATVQIFDFGESTAQELHQVLGDLMAQNPSELTLDLRDNGGGYLDAAVSVASEFIPSGVILYEEYADGHRVPYEVEPGGLATDIPLTVLVNERTASASEIVAGAIQSLGRGKLIGTTTYGKGTVQYLIPLSDNQGAVRITFARWLLPDGTNITHRGLAPDIVLQVMPEGEAAPYSEIPGRLD